MKLRSQSKGHRVAIRENELVYERGTKRVNTYDLIIPLGKGKARAMMLKVALEKVLRVLLASGAE